MSKPRIPAMRPALFVTCILAAPSAFAGTIELKVYGLVCGFCAQGIEKTLRRDAATADVLVSLEHKLVAIETRAGADIPDETLRRALEDAGYDVREIRRTERPLAEIRATLKKDGTS